MEGASSIKTHYSSRDPGAILPCTHRRPIACYVASDTGALMLISGLKQTHGVAVAKEFGRGFISDGDQGKVAMFDLNMLSPTGEVKADQDADCVIYYPVSQCVFVMNGDPYGSIVIDAKSEPAVGTAVADGEGTVYANLEDKNELIAIDSRKLTVKSPLARSARWRAHHSGTRSRAPQALQCRPQSPDAGGDGCRRGHIFQSFPFPAVSMPRPTTLKDRKNRVRSENDGLDSKTHNLFVDTPPNSTPDRPHPQRTAIPGTFRGLVYGR
jgi:hypothetical protein